MSIPDLPEKPRPSRPRVLSIAGTDPTGGAGAQADLKSIMAAGGFGMSVITALVAQNTQGVQGVHTPPAAFLKAQLKAVFDDVNVDAVKIGMLGGVESIEVVSRFLADHPVKWTVLDPVMVATSGDRLLDEEAEAALRQLAGEVNVVTPNIPELEILTGEPIADPPQGDPGQTTDATTDATTPETRAIEAAKRWAADTGTTVIVKFGHLHGPDAGNVAVMPEGGTFEVTAPRIETKNTHGTGCSLSSALATRLVIEDGIPSALGWATAWLNGAIAAADALHVGRGHGPVDHSTGVVRDLSR
ncbi:hydroxymethylpyrimidine/phosphomethylpyrimidine kinase [Corynebacterium heidelbergense]|uniref:Thiamine biosynthesis multifunctional protein ThiED n=1 Tax=Corynebacterium heidelbergense TaxID=2055947 RepID=A0A364VEH8_9CORY|nr:hydroxymethylpyrimidine/phosphomethylpyrimidine kinase [Corynebacterium heidelbergense]